MINDLLVTSPWGELIGFENHSGQTYLTGGQPLGTVVVGSGNNGDDKTEGVRFKNAIGSYLHGPLLPKNPVIADWLIAAGLSSHGDNEPLTPLAKPYLALAREQAIARAKTRRTSSLGLRS
jgi:CobQ-like glutamine amidotransferase family enzyme